MWWLQNSTRNFCSNMFDMIRSEHVTHLYACTCTPNKPPENFNDTTSLACRLSAGLPAYTNNLPPTISPATMSNFHRKRGHAAKRIDPINFHNFPRRSYQCYNGHMHALPGPGIRSDEARKRGFAFDTALERGLSVASAAKL